MPLLLICTVGGTPEAIVASLRCTEPEPVARAVFICSAETRRMVDAPAGLTRQERPCPLCGQPVHECRDEAGLLQRLERENARLDPGCYDIVQLTDPQDLTLCIEELHRELSPIVKRWLDRGPGHTVVADFTGGTKCMSVALALVARSWPASLRYVGGTARNKGGVGVVISGREHVVQARNPWDALGYQAAEQAITLFNHHHYAAAARLLEPAITHSEAPRVKRGLRTLQALCEAFSLWDRFKHQAACYKFAEVERNLNDLPCFLSDACARRLQPELPRYQQLLATLHAQSSSAPPGKELVQDLLANAARRLQEGRYDDAAGRAYRAIEALAQLELRALGFETGSVPLERLPEPLRSEWAGRAREGRLKLALQDDYHLLEALRHPLGQRFRQMGLFTEPDHPSPLQVRNNSIYAHGFQPISEEPAHKLFQAALQLADLDETALIRFPQLEIR